MQIKDRALLRRQAYVDGAWIDGPNGASFAVLNPADGTEIAKVPSFGAAETRRAIAAAEAAFPAWRALTARERSRHGIEEYLEMKYLCVGGI